MHAPPTVTSQNRVGARRLWRAQNNPYSARNPARARRAAPTDTPDCPAQHPPKVLCRCFRRQLGPPALNSTSTDAAVDVIAFAGRFWRIFRLRWLGTFV